MKAIPFKIDNVDSLSADEFNPNSAELENAITKSGQTLDESNTNQFGEAMGNYGSGGSNFYDDVGVVNSYTLSPVDPGGTFDFLHPSNYFEGMSIQCVANFSSTGSSQINVNGIGTVNLKDATGGALVANSIIGGTKFSARFDNTAGEFRLDPAGQGNVVGTGSANTNEIMVADSNSSQQIKSSGITISDIGKFVQTVMTNFSSVLTSISILPQDDTIPQISEGIQVMTQNITPKSSTSRLIIEVVGLGSMVTGAGDPGFTLALFKGNNVNAIAATGADGQAEQALQALTVPLTLNYNETSGSLTLRTYSVRMGGNSTNTFTFNGISGGRRYGGIAKSSIKITEVLF